MLSTDRAGQLGSACRVFAAGFVFLLLAGPLVAAASPIRLDLDREDGCYAEGETAILTIRLEPALLEEGGWIGAVSSQRNWIGPQRSETFAVSSEPVRLEFEESEPGQLIVTVTVQAEDDPQVSYTSRIGMLFQPDQIVLSTPEPPDFDTFWEGEKRVWRALPQTLKLAPVPSPREGVLCWDLTLHLEGETPVSGYLALPEAAAESSLPALLLLHGAGVRSSSLSSAARFASMGLMALEINAHGLPNGRPEEFYLKQDRGALAGYRQRGSESRESWYFRAMYLRIVSAIDLLCERPEWNGRDLVLRGSSQGGGQALAGAGLDSRVNIVAASVPGLCDLSGEIADRKAGWPQPVTAAASKGADAGDRVLEAVGYFDCGIHARRIRAATILSLGLADPTCPAVGIQAMANELTGPVEFLHRPAMRHALPADIQRAFDRFIVDRLPDRLEMPDDGN